MAPKMKSCAEIFADKGDPWISEKEREKDYPQFLTERAEIDRYLYASRALSEKKGSNYSKRSLADPAVMLEDKQRRLASIAHRLNKRIYRHSVKVS